MDTNVNGEWSIHSLFTIAHSPTHKMITQQYKSFSELTVEELYKILQLRSAVFVVEQESAYQNCDGKNLVSYHFMGQND